MEGATSELEIDSELVMSFYDQYQADDLAGKVYGVNTGLASLDDPDSGGTGDPGSVIELKAVLPCSPGQPDVSNSVQEAGHSSWNLPDLLVGLEGGQGSVCHRPSPPPSLPPTSVSIPSCTTPDSIQQVTLSPDCGRTAPLCLDTLARQHQSDSLLEALLGLGILTPPSVTTVKSEHGTLSSHQGTLSHQYNLLDPGTGVSSVVTDLTTLQVPNFELNVSPKTEPGLLPLGSVSIANIDILAKSEPPAPVPLPLDLIAQHCTLLPPDMVNHHCGDGQTVLIPRVESCNATGEEESVDPLLSSLDNSRLTQLGSFISTDQQIADQTMAELSPIMQDSMKEEEDIVLYSYSVASAGPSSEEDSMEHMELETRGIEMDSSNPSYKSFTRCHLCVRIFSTKANLSSHIRHVHMGEAKHSRVKSIPCPHCQKMFSRKGHMTEHVRTVHEGKKRIYKEVNCQHCGKTFRRKWGLNIHISSAHADLVSSLVK
jgi:uncharacterized C2H2 Zn-finger protein